MITVIAVDDHPVMRDGIRTALQDSDIELVAEAGTAADAVRLAVQHRPDVILMDLGLPDFSGVEAIRQVRAGSPDTAALAFTMTDDADTVFAALRAGATGYLVKGVDRTELALAIAAVAGGEALFLGPGVARRVLSHFAPAPPAVDPSLAQLTDREREILDLMAAGYGNNAIAARLYLSPKTIRNYVSAILDKLQAADRGEAIIRARRSGMGRLEP